MSTTSMAIFLNPGFATYSVYARNASIVVKLLLFHLNIAHHCLFWSLNLCLRTCSIDCFVLIPVCLLFFFAFVSFLDLVTRISSLNLKFIVFVLQLFLYSKNVTVTSRRLETGSTSSGSTLQEEVWQVCIVVSFIYDNYIPRAHARYLAHPKLLFPVRTQLTS